jgi:hypothetical protein
MCSPQAGECQRKGETQGRIGWFAAVLLKPVFTAVVTRFACRLKEARPSPLRWWSVQYLWSSNAIRAKGRKAPSQVLVRLHVLKKKKKGRPRSTPRAASSNVNENAHIQQTSDKERNTVP